MRKRSWLCIFLGAVLLGVLVLQLWQPATLETGSWGLKFDGEGEPPAGNASSAQLSQFDAVYMGDPEEKVLYLTFDAGYENGCTSKILDTLKEHQVQATFFLVGDYLERNPDLVRRMASEGHVVGNHTMNHPDMSKLKNPDTFARELEDMAQLYQEITGQPLCKLYRPPQGIYSEENLKMAGSWGITRCSGVLPTRTGTTTPSPAGTRPSGSSFPGPTTGPLSCSTPPPPPMPPFWMSF